MAANWRVTSQTQVSQLTANGTFEDSMEVRFETQPEGTPGMVTVSLRYYTPEYVADMIEARVAAIKAVQAL